MTYDDLLQQARRTELFQDETAVESAVKAVLGILTSRLDEEPARRFASVLPKPLTYEALHRGQKDVTTISVEQYINSVAKQFTIRNEHAQRLINSVLQVVTVNLPRDVFELVRNDLPADWKELLQRAAGKKQ